MGEEPTGQTILVVDDEPMIRDLLCAQLEGLGHEVATAASGQEGLEYLARTLPALLLLDLYMPDLNGVQTLEQIRRRWPALPVVVVSGAISDDLLQQSRRLGISAVLAKPFLRGDLAAVIDRALGRMPEP
jgi:two-component system response regulator (stage 0 sporulation protein F)